MTDMSTRSTQLLHRPRLLLLRARTDPEGARAPKRQPTSSASMGYVTVYEGKDDGAANGEASTC